MAAFLLLGCPTTRDLRMLQAQIDEIEREQKRIQGTLDRVDSLALSGSEETRALVADLKQSVSELSISLDQVEAQVADHDQRLAAGVAAGMAAPVLIPAGSDTLDAGPGITPAGVEDAHRLYQQAFDALKREDHTTAIAGFQAFIAAAPDAEEASSALYWIGESFYALGETDSALVQFQAVIDRYPESGKVPAALYKAGNIYWERGDKTDAYPYYRRLKEEYPQSLEYQQLRRQLED